MQFCKFCITKLFLNVKILYSYSNQGKSLFYCFYRTTVQSSFILYLNFVKFMTIAENQYSEPESEYFEPENEYFEPENGFFEPENGFFEPENE